MQFRKAANYLGFTRTEFIVITSLTGIFLAGLLLKYSFNKSPAPYRDFDYSAADSLFMASGSTEEEEATQVLSAREEAPRALKGSVKDIEKTSFKKKVLAEENSIDLNSAGLSDLMKLPGIGEKTAGRIMELRNRKGRFNSTEELLEVKGIGPAKMNKIRKYIFVK